MAGGKKKKSLGNAKKNKSRRNGDGAAGDSTGNKGKKRPIPLEDVLTQAESAMEMSDLDTALQLFSYASGVLRSRVHAPSATSSDSGVNSNISVHDNDRDKVTLSTVLGKMGEIKASNGDVEGARSNFLDAVDLLDPCASTALSMGTTGSDKMAVDEGGCNLDVAQSCERIAGLYLYLGRLMLSSSSSSYRGVTFGQMTIAPNIASPTSPRKLSSSQVDMAPISKDPTRDKSRSPLDVSSDSVHCNALTQSSTVSYAFSCHTIDTCEEEQDVESASAMPLY